MSRRVVMRVWGLARTCKILAMPRFEFNQNDQSDDWVEQGSRLLSLAVRGCGLILLAVGFVVALMVIASAWSLYDDPDKIEAFARAVERGSNLDLTLSNATSAGRRQLEDDAPETTIASAAPDAMTVAPPALRFSYFIAWLIAILLLLLIGRLALAAVSTGGELALYDVKVGKLARALLRERTQRSAPTS